MCVKASQAQNVDNVWIVIHTSRKNPYLPVIIDHCMYGSGVDNCVDIYGHKRPPIPVNHL